MDRNWRFRGIRQVDVTALLYRPPEDDIVAHRYTHKRLPPGILMIRGGPNWLSQITWDPLIQHMFDFGGVDTDDVVAGFKYLTREHIVDTEKVAVTGRSWGGYLRMTCMTLYPGIWAAGSAVVPFMNWFTAHTNSRADFQHWDIQNFGDPQENYELWYERSPYYFLDEIQASIQMICGANDVRCPASESLQTSEKLLNLSKEFVYVLYPDEGHSFLRRKTL
jgi:dipeptidyl aminopeptidase/acylaminoacyl peptidase